MNLIVEKDPDNYAYNKGIIIKPDIPDLNLIDFKKGKELVKIGYDAIIDSLTTIKQNVNRYISPADVATKRDLFHGKTKEIMIGKVKVEGLNRSQSMFIENIILDKNEIITLEEFKLRYFKIISEDKIKHIYPYLVYDTLNNYYKIIFHAIPAKPFHVNFGGYISANAYTTLFLQLQYKYLGLQSIDAGLDAYFGRFYNSIVLSTRLDYFRRPTFYQMVKIDMSMDYFNTYRSFIE